MDGNFWKKIFFSAEAHFTLGGYIKRQNYSIWCSENSQVIEERPLHPEIVTAGWALWSERPYSLENNDGTIVAINSKRYGYMTTKFFCLLLKNKTCRICGFNKTVPYATQFD